MKTVVIFFAVALFGNAYAQESSEKSEVANILEAYELESEGEFTSLNITFSKSIKSDSVRVIDHNGFIDIEIDKVLVLSPGRVADGSGPLVNRVVALQSNAEQGVIRLFVTSDAAKIAKASLSSVLDRRVIISFDHSKVPVLKPSLKVAKNELSEVSRTPISEPEIINEEVIADSDVDKVIATTKIDRSIGDPAKNISVAAETKTQGTKAQLKSQVSGVSQFDSLMEDKLAIAALFSLGMLSLLGLFLMIQRKRHVIPSIANKFEKPVMKSLGQFSLGARRQLNLMEVEGQKLLLALSGDQVSLLTNIDAIKSSEKSKSNSKEISFQKMLEASAKKKKRPNDEGAKKARVDAPKRSVESKPIQKSNNVSPEYNTADDVASLIRKKLNQIPKI